MQPNLQDQILENYVNGQLIDPGMEMGLKQEKIS